MGQVHRLVGLSRFLNIVFTLIPRNGHVQVLAAESRLGPAHRSQIMRQNIFQHSSVDILLSQRTFFQEGEVFLI